jgi:hypothetical protein
LRSGPNRPKTTAVVNPSLGLIMPGEAHLLVAMTKL